MSSWKKSDAKWVREYQELQELLPESSRKKPRTEKFHLAPTSLNVGGCPTEGLQPPHHTEEYAEALTYIAHMHMTDAEIKAIDSRIPTSTYNMA